MVTEDDNLIASPRKLSVNDFVKALPAWFSGNIEVSVKITNLGEDIYIPDPTIKQKSGTVRDN